MISGKLSKNIYNNEQNIINNNQKEINYIKSNLTCSIMYLNYFDNKDNIFGYPILQYKTSIKNKIVLYPIPELISYKGFISQIGNFNDKLRNYYNNNNNIYNDNNIFYNYWIPIYIDKNHFEKNKSTILYTFSIIQSGISYINEYNFESLDFFEIFVIIINKLIEGILNNITEKSYFFIRCLYHYIFLFKKLSEEFDEEYCKYLNKSFNLIHKNRYKINKTLVPNVQNMIILLYFCNRNIYTEKMKKIWYSLFEEYLLRNMKKNFDGYKIKEISNKIIKEIVDENNPDIKNIILNLIFKNNKYENKYIVENLKKIDIFNKVYEVICTDETFLKKYHWTKNYAKLKLNEIITANFKKIYDEDISEEAQKKLYDIIFNHSNFLSYFAFKRNDRYEYESKIREKYQAKIRNIKISEILDYLSKNKNKEIVKEFIFYSYESLEENKILLLSFFFFSKKNERKRFYGKFRKKLWCLC